jgi:hypothetical protein
MQLVGHGAVTNSKCGTFHTVGCLNVDLHNLMSNKLSGEDHKNQVFVKRIPHSCGKPSCPKCYELWAAKKARTVEMRLAEASRQFAQSGLCNPKVEHVVVSPSSKDYGFSYEEMRAKAFEALYVRGIVGGVCIFHAFRFNKLIRRWIFSPHFHVLGFFLGGYKCRGCKKACQSSCNGLENVTREWNKRDGFIVKVASAWEERKTVGGTAWYQLNHSSIDVSKKCFRVAIWFGVCSYRKLNLSAEVKKEFLERRKSVCPLCKHELVPLRYFGRDKVFFANCFPKKGLWLNAYENGQFVWAEDTHETHFRG